MTELIFTILIAIYVGWIITRICYSFSSNSSNKPKIDNYVLALQAELQAKMEMQEERYTRAQENYKRTRARFNAMNDALVKAGHCPHDELFTDSDGNSMGYGGMMVSQEEWDKSERAQQCLKSYLLKKEEEKK